MKKLDCTLTATYAAPHNSNRRLSSSTPIKVETTTECQSFHYPKDLERPAAATSDEDNAAVVVTNQVKQEEEEEANDKAVKVMIAVKPHHELAKTTTTQANSNTIESASTTSANAFSNANDSVATTTTTTATLPQEISKLESLLDYDPLSSSSSLEEEKEEDIISERQAEKFASHIWTFCKLQKHGWKLYHLKTDIGYGFIPPTSLSSTYSSSSSSSSSNNHHPLKKATTATTVTRAGTRGVHYAEGWVDLYKMIRKYGKFVEGTTTSEYPYMVSYDGPPLPSNDDEQSKAKANDSIAKANDSKANDSNASANHPNDKNTIITTKTTLSQDISKLESLLDDPSKPKNLKPRIIMKIGNKMKMKMEQLQQRQGQQQQFQQEAQGFHFKHPYQRILLEQRQRQRNKRKSQRQCRRSSKRLVMKKPNNNPPLIPLQTPSPPYTTPPLSPNPVTASSPPPPPVPGSRRLSRCKMIISRPSEETHAKLFTGAVTPAPAPATTCHRRRPFILPTTKLTLNTSLRKLSVSTSDDGGETEEEEEEEGDTAPSDNDNANNGGRTFNENELYNRLLKDLTGPELSIVVDIFGCRDDVVDDDDVDGEDDDEDDDDVDVGEDDGEDRDGPTTIPQNSIQVTYNVARNANIPPPVPTIARLPIVPPTPRELNDNTMRLINNSCISRASGLEQLLSPQSHQATTIPMMNVFLSPMKPRRTATTSFLTTLSSYKTIESMTATAMADATADASAAARATSTSTVMADATADASAAARATSTSTVMANANAAAASAAAARATSASTTSHGDTKKIDNSNCAVSAANVAAATATRGHALPLTLFNHIGYDRMTEDNTGFFDDTFIYDHRDYNHNRNNGNNNNIDNNNDIDIDSDNDNDNEDKRGNDKPNISNDCVGVDKDNDEDNEITSAITSLQMQRLGRDLCLPDNICGGNAFTTRNNDDNLSVLEEEKALLDSYPCSLSRQSTFDMITTAQIALKDENTTLHAEKVVAKTMMMMAKSNEEVDADTDANTTGSTDTDSNTSDNTDESSTSEEEKKMPANPTTTIKKNKRKDKKKRPREESFLPTRLRYLPKKRKSLPIVMPPIVMAETINGDKTTFLVCSAKEGYDDAKWEKRLQEAKMFVITHGHSRIPTTYPTNPSLGSWAKRQRYQYKLYTKHSSNMKNMMIARSSLERSIQDSSSLVTNAITINNIDGDDDDDGGSDETSMNSNVEIVKCQLNPQRIQALNDIGFCLDLQQEGWEAQYEMLKEHFKKNNQKHPTKYTHFELYKWIGTQRYQMKKLQQGKNSFLTPERIMKLNSLNFVWDSS